MQDLSHYSLPSLGAVVGEAPHTHDTI
jgi:hypothetical protein